MKKRKPPWIATALIESNEKYGLTNNQKRLNLFLKILKETASKTRGSGILLFPAGYFQSSIFKPSTKYQQWISPIKRELNKIKNRRIVVVFGVDGRNASKGKFPMFKDQIALAVDRNGIVAEARKFHPTNGEKGFTVLAKDYLAKEDGKSRIFELNERKFYLAVCYDLYGIRHLNLTNPGISEVLNLIHMFNKRSDPIGGSGDVYWAKNGMAGASMKWGGVPVYGAVILYGRKIPERWPSGVMVDVNIKNTKTWRYKDNLIERVQRMESCPSQVARQKTCRRWSMTTDLQTLKSATETTPSGPENFCVPILLFCNCRNK